jgi:hypothetical protein
VVHELEETWRSYRIGGLARLDDRPAGLSVER